VGFKTELRRLRGDMTQSELANKLGVSKQVISAWEKGDSFPKLENIVKLSNLFDCDISVFSDIVEPDTIKMLGGNKQQILQELQETYNKLSNGKSSEQDARKYMEQMRSLYFQILLLEESSDFTYNPETKTITSDAKQFQEILFPYLMLNRTGKKEAEKRMKELACLNEYSKEEYSD